MNQILNSDPNINNKNYNNYNSPKNNNGRNVYTDKVIRIFAICLIVFALALISTGVYSYVNNQEYDEEVKSVQETKANISAEEVDGKILIEATHDKEIKQLVYSWNAQKETKVQCEGKSIEKEIDLPAGNNNLLISVFDENGVESTFEKSFESEDGIDIINPEINLKVDGNKLRITVTDETALDFVTYRWNDDEETKITPEDDEKKIEQELEIKKGENDITIIAVDKNKNTSNDKKTFRGVTKPEIIIVSSADGSYLDITCKHESGIKKIEYTLNGQKYEGTFDDKPASVQFTQPLDIGYNRIILTAINDENTSNTFDGQTEYYPEGYDASQEESNSDNQEVRRRQSDKRPSRRKSAGGRGI